MKTRLLLPALSLAFLWQSCKRDNPDQQQNTGFPGPVTNIEQMVVPKNFDYATTKEATLDVVLTDALGTPFKGVKVNVYDAVFEPGKKANLLFTGVTGADGKLYTSFTLPSYLTKVVVYPNMIGIPNNIAVPLAGKNVNFHFTNGILTSKYEKPVITNTSGQPGGSFARKAGIADKFSKKLGTWDINGKPSYLESTNDVLTSDFLTKVNASLPESRPVPVNHPDYLNSTNERNLNIVELSDVYITFVHEGAGYRNGLMYYVYNKNNPPATANDIDSMYIVFPNCSFPGSGGDLNSGNKVKIGRFGPDTVIGFAIAADGFDGTNLTAGLNIWYSNKDFNNEAAAFQQHTILLHDETTHRFLIGFEDLKRDNGSSDEDFNDVVFFATSNPVTGISPDDVPPIDTPADCDGDGVSDVYDDYPCDPTRAYDNYLTPDFGTLAFEDLWPYTGDYDMNDLLLRWQFRTVLNASNKVIELHCKAYVGAKGGSFPVGFGVEFPFNASAVNTVTGADITRSRVTLNSQGLEAGHTKAVMVLFDQASDQLSQPGGSFYNTVNNSPIAYPDTLNLKMTFTSPMNPADIGTYPFNPFVFTTARGLEVHLPDKPATALVDASKLGTGKDNSIPGDGRFYKTKNNLPWALHLPVPFAYPSEKTNIIQAYLKFSEWAQSGGVLYPDWYLNKPGYIDNTKLFFR